MPATMTAGSMRTPTTNQRTRCTTSSTHQRGHQHASEKTQPAIRLATNSTAITAQLEAGVDPAQAPLLPGDPVAAAHVVDVQMRQAQPQSSLAGSVQTPARRRIPTPAR